MKDHLRQCGAFHSLLEFMIADIELLHDFVHKLVDREPFICGWGGNFAAVELSRKGIKKIDRCNDCLFIMVSVPTDKAQDIRKKIEGIVEIEFERIGYEEDTE